MSTKVHLRNKSISKGRSSLYLDFYPPIPNPKTGEPTRREFLGLYILEKPTSPVDKQNNKEVIALAEQIRSKRENQLNKPEVYNEYEKEQLRLKELGKRNFVQYFESLAHKRKASNHDNWISCLNYLKAFTNGHLPMSDLSERWCAEFKEYLLTTKSFKSEKSKLAVNSAVSYFNKIKAGLKTSF